MDAPTPPPHPTPPHPHPPPQQTFIHGPNYLEIDMDAHSYTFLARKALSSYHTRLPTVVWENGFVIQVGVGGRGRPPSGLRLSPVRTLNMPPQGNAPDELPEQILGCARIYRTDFDRCCSLAEFCGGGSSVSAAAAAAATAAAAAAAPPAAALVQARAPSSLTERAGGKGAAAAAAAAAAAVAAAEAGSAARPAAAGWRAVAPSPVKAEAGA
jgi:hypothetical protein